MSNTNNLSIDLLADAVLEGFTEVLPTVVGKFSTNVSPSPGKKGDTVSVPLYGTATARKFAGNYTTNSDSTVNEVPVQLNQHDYCTVHVSDTDAANGIDSFALARQAGAAVAFSVATGFFGIFSTGTYGLPVLTVSSANFGHTGLLGLRDSAVRWPIKNVVMDSSYMTSIYRSATTLSANVANDAVNANITSMYGMGVEETTAQLGPNGQNVKAIVAHPSAACFASRSLIPDGGSNATQYAVKFDEKSRIPITVRMFEVPTEGKTYLTAECNWGRGVGVTGAAKIVTS